MSKTQAHTNALFKETSPYLLQHAHNPVNWVPWSEEAFKGAKAEGKLVLISVGYSACHWCHVMEHESFEDESIASYMNAHFVCIKVDREERPDVDQIYMTAIQVMSGQGGWPLNCFTLADGRPIYGGTYYRPKQWLQVLKSLVDIQQKTPEKMEAYATELTNGIRNQDNLVKFTPKHHFDTTVIDDLVGAWQRNFDYTEGGPNRAPKFPLPNNFNFLLQYGFHHQDKTVEDYVHLTLKKMAFGGIYDQIGGGFSRYSVDAFWKVPHFEKMLYDNGQLLSLYAQAYHIKPNHLYETILKDTIQFVKRELTGEANEFYSALDADSEGVEGKFYVWQKDHLIDVLTKEEYTLVDQYYNINEKGYWEEKNYILLRSEDDHSVADVLGKDIEALRTQITDLKSKLLQIRSKRVKPGLDDKTLTSWNALMVSGLVDAYRVLLKEDYLVMAQQNMQFILNCQKRKDGGLYHTYKKGKSTINGYLEDYCFVIQALIKLYEADQNETWMLEAKLLTDYSIKYFYDESSGFFNFNSVLDPPLISTPREIQDNVIPASNSEMAKNLFILGWVFDVLAYREMSAQMLSNVYDAMPAYGSGYSNWAILSLWHINGFNQVVITGRDSSAVHQSLYVNYFPNAFLMSAMKQSKLPLFKDKFGKETTIYVCEGNTCQLPTTDIEAVKKIIG